MLPLNDSQPNRYGTLPLTTILLIAVNIFIFVWQVSLPAEYMPSLFWLFGFTPADVWMRSGAGMISAVTSLFLHGGFFHIAGNMLFLWVFGRRVEDACGPLRFLMYYLFAGVTANLVTALVQPLEWRPGIGASGAIFGLLGAHLVLFPEGRIRTLWFLLVIPTWPRVRSFWFVLYYLAIQIPPAIDSYLHGTQYSVGHWAHIGGFSACIFIHVFLRPEAFARYISNVDV